MCDADGTGQNNLFKYVAGLDPTNPLSTFKVEIVPTNGQAMNLIFGPISTGRTYGVQFSPDATSGVYADLTGYGGPLTNSASNQVTVTDTNLASPNRFYRLRISLP